MKTALDLVSAAKTHVHEITVDAAEAAIRDADVLIDVREADEFAAGHIPGAINVPRGVLEFKQGFNGYVEELPGEFMRVLRPAIYRLEQFVHTVRSRKAGR